MSDPELHKLGQVTPRDAHTELLVTVANDQEQTSIGIRGLATDPEQLDTMTGVATVVDVETSFEYQAEVRIRKSKIQETGHFIVEHKEAVAGVVITAGTVVLGSLFVRHKKRG
jgi:hypothetical protein